MTTPNAIANWLRGFPEAKDVVPCVITIGKMKWPAARYHRTYRTPFDSKAWKAGEREYDREIIYAVGPLPNYYKKSTHVAFRLAGDDREWYVTGYYPGTEPNEFHPFGPSLMLGPWDIPNQKIDYFEKKPYYRMPLLINAA